MFRWCVLQVGYRRNSRMTERRQVLPLQFRCEAGLMLCNWHLKFIRLSGTPLSCDVTTRDGGTCRRAVDALSTYASASSSGSGSTRRSRPCRRGSPIVCDDSDGGGGGGVWVATVRGSGTCQGTRHVLGDEELLGRWHHDAWWRASWKVSWHVADLATLGVERRETVVAHAVVAAAREIEKQSWSHN